MVVAEVDGVVLRRQRRGVMEAKVCVAYTGKREASPTARHRRRLCQGKVLLAGFYDEQSAGPTFYATSAASSASTGLGTPWCRGTERGGSR